MKSLLHKTLWICLTALLLYTNLQASKYMPSWSGITKAFFWNFLPTLECSFIYRVADKKKILTDPIGFVILIALLWIQSLAYGWLTWYELFKWTAEERHGAILSAIVSCALAYCGWRLGNKISKYV